MLDKHEESMTNRGTKQESLRKNPAKNLFNIASKKLVFHNPFLNNKANNKGSDTHTRFISLSRPERVCIEDMRDRDEDPTRKSIVQLRISPRHPNNNISNNNNNSSNNNVDTNNTNNNLNNKNKKDVLEKDDSRKNVNNSNRKSSISLVTNSNYNDYNIQASNKNNVLNDAYHNNLKSKTNKLDQISNEKWNTNQTNICTNNTTHNTQTNFINNNTINNNIIKNNNKNNTLNNNYNININNNNKKPLTSPSSKGYSNDLMQFLKQDCTDVSAFHRISPPKIFPVSGRLSLNKSNDIVKPIAFRPKTASLLKERRASRNNDNTNCHLHNNTSFISDTYKITPSHHSLAHQKQSENSQPIQQNSCQKPQQPQLLHPHQIPLQQAHKHPPQSNSYDDGYNSQNLSSSSATSSSSSSSHCLPDDQATIPARRPQSSRSHKRPGHDYKMRQSVHSFQKESPESANLKHDTADLVDTRICKSLSGNDVEVECKNNVDSGNINNYKIMLKSKDIEILWLKSQLKKKSGSFDEQADEKLTHHLQWKVQKDYTEEDLMLRILELKKENQLLNSHLEALETNLKEVYREKDEATRLLEGMKEQLERTHLEASERLNEMVSVRMEGSGLLSGVRRSNQSDRHANQPTNIGLHSTGTSNKHNNPFNDNASTSSKLSEVIDKMEELRGRSEEDKTRWQEERRAVVEYQRRLQGRLLESSEARWGLENELRVLRKELERRRTTEKMQALAVESYC